MPQHAQYRVFDGEHLVASFDDAWSYDTATPAQWCIKRLRELAAGLVDPATTYVIEHASTRQTVSTPSELRRWVSDVFCANVPWDYGLRLDEADSGE